MYKFLLFLLLAVIVSCNAAMAQKTDSLKFRRDTSTVKKKKYIVLDSATIARIAFIKDSTLLAQDSIKAVQDSISIQLIKAPLANRPNLFVAYLLKKYLITDKYLLQTTQNYKHKTIKFGTGDVKNYHKLWIIISIIGLIISFAFLRLFYAAELAFIFAAFYHTKTLKKINNEKNIFSSWQFLYLFILFSATAGLYLYLLTNQMGNIYNLSQFKLFLSLAVLILTLLATKITLLKFLGFVFNLQKMVKQYINILYITLFNTLFILLPIVLILALITRLYASYYIWFSVVCLGVIYVVRFVRAWLVVLGTHTFSKVYLFLYICSFELCPLIILIKALNIA